MKRLVFLALAFVANSIPLIHDELTYPETEAVAAGLARALLQDEGIGTLASIMTANDRRPDLEGYPFGSMEYYADECPSTGSPIMYLADIALNVRNAKADNRVSLAVRKLSTDPKPIPVADPRVTLFGYLERIPDKKIPDVKACYFTKHPGAKRWSRAHIFRWYTFHVEQVFYIGGFGDRHYIGWIDTELFKSAAPDTKQETPTLRAQNEDYALFL